EQDAMRQCGCGNRFIAEPANQREVDRHHGDLPELRKRERTGELYCFDQLVAPDARARRRRNDAVPATHPATIAGQSGRGSGAARWLARLIAVRGDEELAIAVAASDLRREEQA